MNQKRGGLPTKLSWILRMLVGAYIVFLDYQIIQSSRTTGDPLAPGVIVAMVIFAVSGTALVGWGIRGLSRGEYIGGAMDRDREQNQEETHEEIETKSEDS